MNPIQISELKTKIFDGVYGVYKPVNPCSEITLTDNQPTINCNNLTTNNCQQNINNCENITQKQKSEK